MSEYGLEGTNAFSGTYMPDKSDASIRRPIPNDILKLIQEACQSTDDEPRWLIALISDTGMRLAESAGLAKEDIHLDGDIPYVDIKPHPWRRLKTNSSIRRLPLVEASLWAARRAYIASNDRFMFPKYCDEIECHSNSASAALNKWLNPRVPIGCVMHSFRHSLRDRLRAVECPADIIDAIGGWTTEGIGLQYGEGHSLSVKLRWMKKLLI